MAYIMYSGTLWQFKHINIDYITLKQDPQEGCDFQLPLLFFFVICLAKMRRNVHALNNLITVLSVSTSEWNYAVTAEGSVRAFCLRNSAVEGMGSTQNIHSYRANQLQKASRACPY